MNCACFGCLVLTHSVKNHCHFFKKCKQFTVKKTCSLIETAFWWNWTVLLFSLIIWKQFLNLLYGQIFCSKIKLIWVCQLHVWWVSYSLTSLIKNGTSFTNIFYPKNPLGLKLFFLNLFLLKLFFAEVKNESEPYHSLFDGCLKAFH